MDRDDAIDRVETILTTIESEIMPVPIREIWVFGDVALGLDPINRLDVYLTKDMVFGTDTDREQVFEEKFGIKGVGKTVRADWARSFPQYLRANDHGHAAPERCLAAHLIGDSSLPIHLEICNAGFESNVTQRLDGAIATESFDKVLDPRGVCLWIDGQRSETALKKLRSSSFPFPTLPEALKMLGAEDEIATVAAKSISSSRRSQSGPSIRSDVV